MDTVQVNDKRFRRYLSEAEIQDIVRRVAADISRDYKGKDVVICPVLTGACMFATDLARALDFDPEISFVRYSSYSGMASTGKVKCSLPFSEICRHRHVIIVEDIVDSGISMDFMLNELHRLEPASVSVCAFFYKPGNFQAHFKIDYVGLEIPNDFIVGYGLDYNEHGRTYKDVYIIDE